MTLCSRAVRAANRCSAALHTEDLVTTFGISKADQDIWAERSQRRFADAQAAGLFEAEIAAVEVKRRKGPEMFTSDEHNRPETTWDSLT